MRRRLLLQAMTLGCWSAFAKPLPLMEQDEETAEYTVQDLRAGKQAVCQRHRKGDHFTTLQNGIVTATMVHTKDGRLLESYSVGSEFKVRTRFEEMIFRLPHGGTAEGVEDHIRITDGVNAQSFPVYLDVEKDEELSTYIYTTVSPRVRHVMAWVYHPSSRLPVTVQVELIDNVTNNTLQEILITKHE